MILQGKYGKGLSVWMRDGGVELSLRGPAGTHDWSDVFTYDEALRFFLVAALEAAERLRVRPAPVAPDGAQP